MSTENRPSTLKARQLTVRFGDAVALDGLDLDAPAGQVLALLGPNGAGKTTFVRAVATLLRPSSGSLTVCGHDVAQDPVSVRRSIGLAGQYAAVETSMTGRENLEMTARLFGHGRHQAGRAAAAVIDQFDLGEVADRRAGTYSGGQRRRLDLGSSLVGAPRLLLLDEPTTGLDPVSRDEVWTAVRRLVQGGTDVLLTTHYLQEADELADHVVVIDHGRAIASGTVGQLKAGVGRDVIEVTVADRAGLPRAGAVLQRVASTPVSYDQGGRQASVSAAGGPAQLREVIDGLYAAGVVVDEVGLRRPTLDEVFAVLTRHRVSVGSEV